MNYLFVIYLSFPIVCLLTTFVIWYLNCKVKEEDKKIHMIENITPIDAAIIMKKDVVDKDIIATLMHLANKGYIELIKGNKNRYEIIKLKDYDDNNEFEKILFYGMFYEEEKYKITLVELKIRFKKIMYSIRKQIKKELKTKKYFVKSFSIIKGMCIALLLCSLVILFNMPVYNEGLNYLFSNKDFFEKFCMKYAISILIVTLLYKGLTKKDKICIYFLLILLSILFLLNPVVFVFRYNTRYLIAFLIGSVSCCINFYLIKNMHKRTEEGKKIYIKLIEFKKFLITSNEGELNVLLVVKPNYFYEVLPFVYSFGITNLWLNKFENIQINQPNLKYNNSLITFTKIKKFMKKEIKKVSKETICIVDGR